MRRTDGRRRQTREDRATQPMDDGWLSFAKTHALLENSFVLMFLRLRIHGLITEP